MHLLCSPQVFYTAPGRLYATAEVNIPKVKNVTYQLSMDGLIDFFRLPVPTVALDSYS